jgi:hypothetical protein
MNYIEKNMKKISNRKLELDSSSEVITHNRKNDLGSSSEIIKRKWNLLSNLARNDYFFPNSDLSQSYGFGLSSVSSNPDPHRKDASML